MEFFKRWPSKRNPEKIQHIPRTSNSSSSMWKTKGLRYTDDRLDYGDVV
ncbi:MAG: hypothetical protein ACJATI_004273 [Halioglobus sp.]|jgi:hypothetical protein